MYGACGQIAYLHECYNKHLKKAIVQKVQQTFKEGDCVLERAAAFEFFHALLGNMKRIIGVRAPGVGELEDGHAHN